MKTARVLIDHRNVALSVLAGALATLLGGCVPPPPPEPVLPDLGGRVVTVALLPDFLPYCRIDPQTGAVEGWDYDLITAMAAKLNFEPSFVAADMPTLLANLAAQRYDIAGSGISFTLDRVAELDFAAPYRLVKQRIAVRAADSRVATVAQFHDDAALRVGTVPGTTTYDMAVAYLGAVRVASYDTFSAAMDALLAGAVDGAVLDDIELQREQQRADAFKTLSGPLAGDILAYPLPKGSDLTAPIEAAYQVLLLDGTVAALRQKWNL